MGRRSLKPGSGGAEGSTLAKDRIVEAIAWEMAEGKWRPFRSVRELAAKLGVTIHNAQRYTAEATRLLRLSWGQEEAKLAVLERISQIGRAAEERIEEAIDAQGNVHQLLKPDHRTALAAAKHLSDILGMSGANAEVVVRYQQMSDSDLWHEAQRFVAQLPGANTNGIETSAEEVPDGSRDRGTEADDQAALDRLNAASAGRGR